MFIRFLSTFVVFYADQLVYLLVYLASVLGEWLLRTSFLGKTRLGVR